MLIQQVDALHPKSLKGALDCPLESPLCRGTEPALHPKALRSGTGRTLRGVKERDAAVHSGMEKISHLLTYLWADHKKSSFPCSRGRWQRLPSCCFRVSVVTSARMVTPPMMTSMSQHYWPNAVERYPDPS